MEVPEIGSNFIIYFMGSTHNNIGGNIWIMYFNGNPSDGRESSINIGNFQNAESPIFDLPDLLSVLTHGKVSADRLAIYLQEDEINSESIEVIPRNETEFDIEIDHGALVGIEIMNSRLLEIYN